MQEAYSREECSAGWWPSSDPPGPAFYAYVYPEPAGYEDAAIGPADAFYDARLDEFLLPYDAIREAADPDAAVLEFLRSTYEAGADLAGWDRAILEPMVIPGRRPSRPWTPVGETVGSGSRDHRRTRRPCRPGHS